MTTTPDNRHPHELISASFDAEISPKERAEAEAHLATCPECRALIEDLPVLRAAIASETPPPPPESLAARISWRIASAEHDVSHARTGRRWYALWPPLAAGGLAAALLLTFVLLRTNVPDRMAPGRPLPAAEPVGDGEESKKSPSREPDTRGYSDAPGSEAGSDKRAASGRILQEAPRALAPENLSGSGAGMLREADVDGKHQFALGGSIASDLRARPDSNRLRSKVRTKEGEQPGRQSGPEPPPAGSSEQQESDQLEARDERSQRLPPPPPAEKAEASRRSGTGRPERARPLESGGSGDLKRTPSPAFDAYAPSPPQGAIEGAQNRPESGVKSEPASPGGVAPPPAQAPEPAFIFVRDEASTTCKLGIERPGGAIVIRADDAGRAIEFVRDLVRKLSGSTEAVKASSSTLRVELPPARAREFFSALLPWGVPPLPPDFPEHPMVKPDCLRLVLRFEAPLSK